MELKRVALKLSAALGKKMEWNEEQYASMQVFIINVEIAIL